MLRRRAQKGEALQGEIAASLACARRGGDRRLCWIMPQATGGAPSIRCHCRGNGLIDCGDLLLPQLSPDSGKIPQHFPWITGVGSRYARCAAIH
jgi:hypothetical protein